MRLENWEIKLDEHLKTVGAFEWGTNDCCMFAVNCVKVITGIDHGKEYRGYKTKVGAARRLLKYGGVEGIATKELGDPKPVKQAKRGDVVSVDQGDVFLGIHLGDKIAAVSESGLIFLKTSVIKNAWSV